MSNSAQSASSRLPRTGRRARGPRVSARSAPRGHDGLVGCGPVRPRVRRLPRRSVGDWRTVSTNTGPSLVIDGQGRVVAEVPVLFSEGAATADVALRGPGLTPYARGGDGLALALVTAATAALVPMTGTRRDRKGEDR